MQLSDFQFDLPEELIAQTPAEPRDSSRLMIVTRSTGEINTDHHFRDLPRILNENYAIILNDSRVMKSRLPGYRGDGSPVDLFLLRDLGENRWHCQDCSEVKLKQCDKIRFEQSALTAEVTNVSAHASDHAHHTVECRFSGCGDLLDEAERIGHLPLPPYIKSTVGEARYQTVYARESGSVAAPTAGLHFTPEVFAGMAARGIEREQLTLHVGYGTFSPVETEALDQHAMHSEHFTLTEGTAARLNHYKQAGKKIMAVGTTTTRVLESCADKSGRVNARSGETRIFIYPPYTFKVVDAMLTNFHVPGYTPLMLVAALAGYELIRD